jgi:hypothetical protein
MKRPNLKLTNKTKIAEREVFCHQPRRSLHLTKLQVTAIRKYCMPSQANKRTLVGIAKGWIVVVDSRDNNIHAGWWYKKHLPDIWWNIPPVWWPRQQ